MKRILSFLLALSLCLFAVQTDVRAQVVVDDWQSVYDSVVETGHYTPEQASILNSSEDFISWIGNEIDEGLQNLAIYTSKDYDKFLDYVIYNNGYFATGNTLTDVGAIQCLFDMPSCKVAFQDWYNGNTSSSGGSSGSDSPIYSKPSKPVYDSGYRNYYNSNSYNSTVTNTTYTQIYNQETNKLNIFNNVSNTWNSYDVDNWYYDITNNHYTYNTNNYTYDVDYNYNYTYINYYYVGSGVSEGTHSYYFKLPDGSNSYNATKESIYGLKLDFEISNYDTVYDDDGVIGLYHFDGDNLDSSYRQYLLNLSTSFSSYTESGSNFGSFPYIKSPVIVQDYEVTNSNFMIDFRYFRTSANTGASTSLSSRNSFYSFAIPVGDYYLYYGLGLSYINVSKYDGYATKIEFNNSYGLYLLPNDVFETIFLDSNLSFYRYSNKTLYFYYNSYSVDSFTNLISKYCINSSSSDTAAWGTFVFDILDSSLVLGGWVSLRLLVNDSNFYFYLNGVEVGSGSYTVSSNLVNLYFGGGGYFNNCNIDELRFVSKSDLSSYIGNYQISNVPFDTNLRYVLPDVDTNNRVLIQSLIPVSDWQIGGVRKSLPEKGDVFVALNDDNLVISTQQYNGSDWIEIPMSVYDLANSKWVDLVGYSVINDTFVKGDDSSSSGSLGSDISWDNLSSKLDEIIQVLNDGFDSISFDITQIESASIWDFFITLLNKLIDGFNSIAESLLDTIIKLLVPDNLDSFNNLFDTLTDNLGVLALPVTIFSELFNGFIDLFVNYSSNSFEFTTPVVYAPNSDIVLFQEYRFNFYDLISPYPELVNLYNTYLSVIDLLVFGGIIALGYRRLGEFFK